MKKLYEDALFQKILVPVIQGCDYQTALAAACASATGSHILLVGIVNIPQGESLSLATSSARQTRKKLQELANLEGIRISERVRVTHNPWEEIVKAAREEAPDLLVLETPCHFEALGITPDEALANPPCNVAIVRGPVPERPKCVLSSIRGGPYAELALRLSLAIGQTSQAQITSLHLLPSDVSGQNDAPFRGLDQVLAHLPEIHRREIRTDNPVETILDVSRQFDLLVMGATANPEKTAHWIGHVAGRVLEDCPAGVIVVKTQRPMPQNLENQSAGSTAISVLVDKWFAENTYHAEEFEDLDYLLFLKRQQELTISLALPALNEEKTVGNVISTIKSALMDSVPLLDEIVLIDSNSTDRTRELAASCGIPVYIHQEILPQMGARSGKGEALWKSLLVTRGDILVWIDTDIVNIHPAFVYGLLGPLLQRPNIQYVKGFYRRPLRVGDKIQAGGGGRVTELTARPLLNLFYPELSGVIQPLSGEYGGRRSALEQLPFFSGYGVEIGMLIEVLEKFGLRSIAQVDLMERIHHNQPLESLSKMSFAIIQAVFRKLERRYGRDFLEDVNKTMKLIRYQSGRLFLEVDEIAELERPAMIEISDYQNRFHCGALK